MTEYQLSLEASQAFKTGLGLLDQLRGGTGILDVCFDGEDVGFKLIGRSKDSSSLISCSTSNRGGVLWHGGITPGFSKHNFRPPYCLEFDDSTIIVTDAEGSNYSEVGGGFPDLRYVPVSHRELLAHIEPPVSRLIPIQKLKSGGFGGRDCLTLSLSGDVLELAVLSDDDGMDDPIVKLNHEFIVGNYVRSNPCITGPASTFRVHSVLRPLKYLLKQAKKLNGSFSIHLGDDLPLILGAIFPDWKMELYLAPVI